MSVQPAETAYREKRRHARQPTLRDARLHLGDSGSFAVQIRDYCESGLFLTFAAEHAGHAAFPVLIGTPVQIEIDAAAPGGLRFKGRVARAAPRALGVFVHAMPADVLDYLRCPSSQDAPEPTPAPARVLPEASAQGLKRECSQVLHVVLDAVLQDVFLRGEAHLNAAGMESPSFLERSRFDYGARELNKQRRSIETACFGAVRERIDTLDPAVETFGAAAFAEAPRAPGKLALVDEDEFEDWLNLSAVIQPLETDLALALDTFEARYGRLVGARITRKNNPFGPESIGRAFQSALRVVDFSNAMRAVLYKTLGQALAGRSVELYERLNQILVSLQTDESPQRPEPEPQADVRDGEDDTAASDTALAEALANLFKPDRGGIEARGSGKNDYSLDRILSGIGTAPRAADAPRVTSRPLPPGADADTSVVPTDVLQIARRLRQSVRRLGPAGDAAEVAAAAAPGVDTSVAELKQILDRVAADTDALAGPLGLTERLAAILAQDSGRARRLAPLHRQVLDRAADFFVRTHADLVPDSDIETLLRRLQAPLLKLALEDASFPDQPNHPARQVIDRVEQFAVAADDHGKVFDPKLQRFLELLVDRICTEDDPQPDLFVTVRDQLDKVLGPILQIRRTRVARMQEACEGRERIRAARARVNDALEQMLGGRDVPGMILRLLDAGWRHHLVLLEMRVGVDSDTWRAALNRLEQVLDVLNTTAAAAPGATPDAEALLDDIEHGLKSVNVDTQLLASFVDELGACLKAPHSAQVRGCAMVHVPSGKLARQVGPGRAAPDTAYRFLVNRLRVGDWWDIETAGKPVPMQLIWASDAAAVCTFANRSATHKIEYTLADLSLQVRSRQARPGKDRDMSVIERAEHALFDESYQELMNQVLHDETTGLLNRKGFMQRLKQTGVPDDPSRSHAIGIIEFDQFRVIYNTCGVEAVESLARALAREARAKMGPDAVLAAFRDDTLAVLLPNCNRATGCEIIDQLLAQLRDYRFEHGAHSYRIGFNLGLAEFAPAQISPSDAIRRADSACIAAKAQGRNRMQIYEDASPQLQTQVSLMDWAGRIDAFLTGDGLHLRCQQVMPLDPDAPYAPHYEILLGIEDGQGVEINPMHFIPALEALQRAHEIDMWVVRKVFAWIAANRRKFDALGGFAINLSATSLSSPDVMAFLKEALRSCSFPTQKITFEITETAAIGSYGAAQDFIREIRRYGCRFALDDFGSGFTSYAHLKNLRTDALKIDGSFVKDMLNNPGDFAMVKSMNDIAHSLGLKTIAEYVESPTILQALRQIGVDYAQGYAVHKPCAIDELPGGAEG